MERLRSAIICQVTRKSVKHIKNSSANLKPSHGVIEVSLTEVGLQGFPNNGSQRLHCDYTTEIVQTLYSDIVSDLEEYDDESCTIDFDADIETTAKGYRLTWHIPSAFHKYIIGKKGETKKRLEIETRTLIKVPRQREDGDVGIYCIM